jgi:hypothetical protein
MDTSTSPPRRGWLGSASLKAKEGNCFTRVADPAGLAQVADTLSHSATAGRLSQVCDRWIHSACLCFGLDLDDQERSGFRYGYSVFQVEYSRDLLFACGRQMDRVFNMVVVTGPSVVQADFWNHTAASRPS